jgi:hypothetical protein
MNPIQINMLVITLRRLALRIATWRGDEGNAVAVGDYGEITVTNVMPPSKIGCAPVDFVGVSDAVALPTSLPGIQIAPSAPVLVRSQVVADAPS